MTLKVRSYRSSGLIVVNQTDTIEEARRRMNARGIRHLPVVNEQQEIVGIISNRDISHRENPTETVQDRMYFEVLTIEDGKSVSEAASIMITEKVSSLLVLKDELVVGIITSEDLLRVLTEEHLNEGPDLSDRVQSQIYNSPIGAIVNQLAAIGL